MKKDIENLLELLSIPLQPHAHTRHLHDLPSLVATPALAPLLMIPQAIVPRDWLRRPTLFVPWSSPTRHQIFWKM